MSVLSSAEVLDHVSGSYQLDPAHSRLRFAVRHALVTKVHGRFDSVEGRAHFDASDPTNCSIALTIDATSIRTNNADRDGHLRSADFFDVKSVALTPGLDIDYRRSPQACGSPARVAAVPTASWKGRQ